MTNLRKLLVPAAVAMMVMAASVISYSQAQQPGAPASPGDVLIVDDAQVEFIEKSDVTPLTEGVLETMEAKIGMTVQKYAVIGKLYSKKALLQVKKAETAAKSVGALRKAEAQRDQTMTIVARNRRLLKTNPTYVSREDAEKAEADVKMTLGMIDEATESQAVAAAELDLARNLLSEHQILAPFTGVVLKVSRHPGESVKSNEPVVRIGNLDRMRVYAFVPLETSFRLSEGSEVDFQLTVRGRRGGELPIEKKKFHGTITFIDPELQAEVATEVRIYAEFANESHELKAGMKGSLTLHLDPAGAAPVRRAVTKDVAPEAAAAEIPAAALSGGELPALPR